MLLIAAAAAIAMFAADDTTQAAAPAPQPAAAAEAKPATKRVCETYMVSGSNMPRKTCRDVPVKAEGKVAEKAPAKADAPKSE